MNAISQEHGRIPIQRVAVPGEAWLELKGAVLVVHKRNWLASSSVYIPVEWLRITAARRRDLRRCWQGLFGILVAVLLSLPLSLLVFYMRPLALLDVAIGATLAGLLLVALGTGLWSLAAFLRPRDAVRLSIEGNPAWPALQFWRGIREDARLAPLLDRLQRIRKEVGERMPHPVHVNHGWYRPRPYRVALVKGLAVSFYLYLAFLVLELLRFTGYGPDIARWYYIMLAAPPLFYVGGLLVHSGLLRQQPVAYREAVHSYARGALAEAAALLDQLLEARPGHDAGRVLMIQVSTERYAFEEAFRHCAYLARQWPEMAERLQANIWGIKRLYERMQFDVEAKG